MMLLQSNNVAVRLVEIIKNIDTTVASRITRFSCLADIYLWIKCPFRSKLITYLLERDFYTILPADNRNRYSATTFIRCLILYWKKNIYIYLIEFMNPLFAFTIARTRPADTSDTAFSGLYPREKTYRLLGKSVRSADFPRSVDVPSMVWNIRVRRAERTKRLKTPAPLNDHCFSQSPTNRRHISHDHHR